MRRSSTMLGMVLGLVLSALPAGMSASPAQALPAAAADPTSLPADPVSRPAAALEAAGRALGRDSRPTDPDASIALRDLWLARPDLTGAAALEADALLARPTDGAADPYDDGYAVPATSQCGAHVCVHYVTSTADAPPSVEWATLSLAVMENVYTREVSELGYRAPRSDGRLGGDGRLDVYLKELGRGLYGYCAPEFRKKGRTASGFCVLDNDYAPSQFPGSATTPENNLVVTAAHEFFHAVQFSYDYAEDPWMMESTATWMEEQVADDINDNRQFLSDSQLQVPGVPLDTFSRGSSVQYGNWIYFQYLTQRFGTSLVKKAWESAGSLRKDGGRYSLEALQSVLRKKKKSFTDVYADFAVGNFIPSITYPEAAGVPEYAAPAGLADVTLTRADKGYRHRTKLDHLSSNAIHLRPAAELSSRKWKLRVQVSGPRRSASPAGRLILHKVDGSTSIKRLRFTVRGSARTKVPFSSAKIAAVTVSFANVSTRYKCGRRTDYACAGVARDDNKRFTIVTKAVKQRKRRN